MQRALVKGRWDSSQCQGERKTTGFVLIPPDVLKPIRYSSSTLSNSSSLSAWQHRTETQNTFAGDKVCR